MTLYRVNECVVYSYWHGTCRYHPGWAAPLMLVSKLLKGLINTYIYSWGWECSIHFTALLNPKSQGVESTTLQHFLLYLCRLLFFRAETSWLFSFKPCARFKTIFIKIGPRVMTRHCVIARWVQRKPDFPLKLHTNRVFCLFCLSGYTSTMFYLIYLVYLE